MSEAERLEEDLEEEVLDEEEILDEEETEEPSKEDAELAARAKRAGWVEKEHYRGTKPWVDAKTFLETGETVIPVMRERLKKQDSRIAELQDTIDQFREHYNNVEARAYARAEMDIKAKQRQAVSEGNTEEWDKLEKQREELIATNIPPPKHQPTGPSPIYEEWEIENDWLKDDEMREYAEYYAGKLSASRKDLIGKREFLDKVTDRVKHVFKHNFQNPARNKPPSVEGDATISGRNKREKGWDDIPVADRNKMLKYVKEKLASKEQLAADYWDQ